MADWDPSLYSRFEDERTRPAFDLLQRVTLNRLTAIVDLGCGPGNSTELLANRYPGAAIHGIDSSAAMIAAAESRLPGCRFEQADVAVWSATQPPDLIFANAVLQWVPDHQRLLPRLLAMLASGGVLAIQMPDTLDEPSHRAMRSVASEDRWSGILAQAAQARTRILGLDAYYDLLSAQGAAVDVWRTRYHHPMASPGRIVDWLCATGLRPFLDPLSAADHSAFLARYEEEIDRLYPVRADGQRLLGFPRVFMVAKTRPAA